MSADARAINASIWDGLYDKGLVISYPNDIFVRVAHRLLKPDTHPKVLDYGFGSGQNALHLARKGFQVHGVEVSPKAVENATKMFADQMLTADFKFLASPELPYPDETFDAVLAWGVLEYNDWNGFAQAVSEIERIMREGGIFLAAINAPGDAKQLMGNPLGNGLYSLREESGQGNAIVLILERDQLQKCFPNQNLTIGFYEHSFDGNQAKHWIVSFRKVAKS